MRNKILVPTAIAFLALTTACSNPAPSEEPDQTPQATETEQPEEQETPEESPQDSEPEESDSQKDATPSTDLNDPLIVVINGEEADFNPTDVYCKVGGGELRHLIAKTNNQPPLLEVTPGEFAMLKLQKKGAPEKNTNPSGIEYLTDGVIFTDAAIGNATLNGGLKCSDVKGK